MILDQNRIVLRQFPGAPPHLIPHLATGHVTVFFRSITIAVDLPPRIGGQKEAVAYGASLGRIPHSKSFVKIGSEHAGERRVVHPSDQTLLSGKIFYRHIGKGHPFFLPVFVRVEKGIKLLGKADGISGDVLVI